MQVFSLPDVFVIFGVLTVVIIATIWRLPIRLLAGLVAYYIPQQDKAAGTGGATKAQQTAAAAQRLTRRQRKEVYADEQLDGAERIGMQVLSESLINQMRGWKEFEHLALFAMVAAAAWLVGEALTAAAGLSSPLPTLLALVVVCGAVYLLAQVEFFGQLTASNERSWMAAIALLAFMAAVAELCLVPTSVLDFGTAAGLESFKRGALGFARQVQARLRSKRVVAGLQESLPADDAQELSVGDVHIHLVAYHITLAVAAATAAGLSFTAAVRTTRCAWLATHPPWWGGSYIKVSPLQLVGLYLHMVLPLLCALLWVKPLVAVWGLPPAGVDAAKAVGLLAAGLLHLALLRTYLQMYSHTALLHWHSKKHGDRQGGANGAQVAAVMRVKVQLVNMLFMKVATQLLAPAVCFIMLGLLLASHSLRVAFGGGAATAQGIGAIRMFMSPEVVGSVAQWGGWWACSTWAGYSVFTLMLLRLNVMEAA